MEKIADKFVKVVEKLPGFGLAFLLATLAYMYLKEDYQKLSGIETLVTAVLCWLLYHLASYLDDLYDLVYGPKSKLSFLPGNSALKDARNAAAATLIGRVDPAVIDYDSAATLKYIGDHPLPSLYSLCSTVAKPTDSWRKKIEPNIDISKAARIVFAFAVVAVLIAKIPLLRDSLNVTKYIKRLDILLDAWVLLSGIALAALLVYVALRILHNVELYEYIASSVKHLSIGDVTTAVIWEVTLSKKSRAFVLGGYAPGNPIDALIAGYYEDGKLLYAATVKNGFVPQVCREVANRLEGLKVNGCPFVNLPEKKWALTKEEMKNYQWLRPVLVAQIEFAEWMPNGQLRDSKFIGLREDKDPKHITHESG